MRIPWVSRAEYDRVARQLAAAQAEIAELKRPPPEKAERPAMTALRGALARFHEATDKLEASLQPKPKDEEYKA
jgi:hypothetical protein